MQHDDHQTRFRLCEPGRKREDQGLRLYFRLVSESHTIFIGYMRMCVPVMLALKVVENSRPDASHASLAVVASSCDD